MRQVSISVIVPFYNEAANIWPFFERLIPVLEALTYAWEVIAIDDGSRDGTGDALHSVHDYYPEVRIIRFSRNFGKEAALSAGLARARGQSVLIMDGDLQHPPETLFEMLRAQDRGVDMVYAIRQSRRTEGPIRSGCSTLFYRVFSMTSDIVIPPNASDFRLMSRRVVDALNALPEQTRFMKGLYAWVGFSQEAVLYEAAARKNGRTKWSFRKLMGYAWNGIISFSVAPLRFWSFVGSVIAALALIYAIWIGISTIAFGRDVPGYATLAVAIFFLGGLQLLSIGVLGEYIARIFAEAKRRPLFVIEETTGFEAEARPRLKQI